MNRAEEGKLTYRGDDEQDEEGVEHRQDRRAQRRDDVAQRPHAAEQPDHPQRPDGPQDVDGKGDGGEGDEREQHDAEVEGVPRVADEGREPVGEHVDCELHGEDRGEELVEQLEGDAGGGG